MIQLASALPTPLAAPGGPAPVLQGGGGDFELALATHMVPPGVVAAQADPAALLAAGLQRLAAPGKDLPDEEGDAGSAALSQDEDSDALGAADPALVWFVPMHPVIDAPLAPPQGDARSAPAVLDAVLPSARNIAGDASGEAIALGVAGSVPSDVRGEAAGMMADRVAGAARPSAAVSPLAQNVPPVSPPFASPAQAAPELTTVSALLASASPAATAASARGATAEAVSQSGSVAIAPEVALTSEAGLEDRRAAVLADTHRAPRVALAPEPVRLAQGTTGGTLQISSAAASVFAAQLEQRGAGRRAPTDLAAGVVASAVEAPAITTAIAATAGAQHAPLDMRRQEWMGRMIDTIEALRDAAPVKETRLTLMPEALGKVDVTVRQDGDRIHVHFAAETQAARQMIQDAQQRLAELAEARGVRLGQTSVDSGGSGTSSGQRHDTTPRMSAIPVSASAHNQIPTNTDERIA